MKTLHPTARDTASLCGAIGVALAWFAGATPAIDDERRAYDAIRALASLRSDATMVQVNEACARIHPATLAPTPARVELRNAILIAARVALMPRADINDETWRAWERLFLTHLINSGEQVGVIDAAIKARTAMDGAKREGQSSASFPEPEYARQRALGFVLANLRRRGKLEQADLCRLVTTTGQAKLTTARLARIESGNPWRHAPIDEIAACLGQTGDELRERGEIAHRFAQALASRAGVTDAERWYAELVSTDGVDTADHYLGVGASTAVRLTIEQLRIAK